MIHHFKGVKQETPEEKKKRIQEEFKAKYNAAVKRAVDEEIWDFINKSENNGNRLDAIG